MKKIFLLIVVIIEILPLLVLAQQVDSTFTDRYLLDFVVPDMPAFKALGTDQSNILRPADAKKFALSLSPFYSTGKAVIPKNFAVEFSPGKLASSKWTLASYNSNKVRQFLYRSSFSIGTVEDTTQYSNKLAFGYRVSFLSKRADILRVAHVILPNMQSSHAAFTELTDYWVINVIKPPIEDRSTYYRTHKGDFNKFFGEIPKLLITEPNHQLEDLYNKLVSTISEEKIPDAELKSYIEAFGASVDKFIEKYKEENWNASRFDLAVAWVGQSSTEMLKNSQFSSFNLWLTFALRAHKDGQLLIGTNLGLPRSQEQKQMTKLSTNIRYYVGKQTFRGFFETQYKIEKNQPIEKTVLLNLGTELRIGSRLWLTLSGGLNNYLAESNPFNKLVSSIDLKYGFNGTSN